MPTEEEARWAQMAAQGGGTATMTTPPAAPAPPAAQAPMAGIPQAPAGAAEMPDMKGKKAKKEKKDKAPKPPKAERAPRSSGRNPLETESNWVMSLDEGPSRQELEQMAAAELFQALAPSYDLLHAEVPDAASPEDAQSRIASQLGPHPSDMDATIPDHPIWRGDALVYSQLKRHYGRPHQGSSFARSWWPGR